MIATDLPEYPWQKTAVDLCEHKGHNYLVTADYFSRFTEVRNMGKTTSPNIIKHLTSIFSRHGFPEIIVSENGSQFVSAEFRKTALHR